MNYYNPYFNIYPYTAPASTSLIGRAIGGGGIKWGSILSGTQKVLGVANQAIPMIKQVKPVVKNARTMFKVMNEFKKTDTASSNTVSTNNESTNSKNIENINTVNTNNVDNVGPTFFA